MAKYHVTQSTKNGKIISSVGDNQQITIHQHQVISSDQVPEIPVPGVPGEGDIIRAVGRGAKVYVNGKRVQ